MTVRERFQVICPDFCGYVGGYPSRDEAKEVAAVHGHDNMKVHDLMARRGQLQTQRLPKAYGSLFEPIAYRWR